MTRYLFQLVRPCAGCVTSAAVGSPLLQSGPRPTLTAHRSSLHLPSGLPKSPPSAHDLSSCAARRLQPPAAATPSSTSSQHSSWCDGVFPRSVDPWGRLEWRWRRRQVGGVVAGVVADRLSGLQRRRMLVRVLRSHGHLGGGGGGGGAGGGGGGGSRMVCVVGPDVAAGYGAVFLSLYCRPVAYKRTDMKTRRRGRARLVFQAHVGGRHRTDISLTHHIPWVRRCSVHCVLCIRCGKNRNRCRSYLFRFVRQQFTPDVAGSYCVVWRCV